MDSRLRRAYFRLIYKRTFGYLSVTSALSLIIGALYDSSLYTVYAFSALGACMVCWGWFTYLIATGLRLPGLEFWRKTKKKIPFVHRKDKTQRQHRPSFRMDSRDFDDDLTAETVVDEEVFSKKQQDFARALSRAICGAILFAVSFFIPLP